MFCENGENRVYLAYGSNLNREQMAWRCPYATMIGPVKVHGYELLFRGSAAGAVATIEPQQGRWVPALLWEITPQCEEALDRYEGYPTLYRKEVLRVTFQGEEVDAMAYIMNWRPLGMPSDSYLSTILQGYDAAGFYRELLQTAVERSRFGRRDRQLPWKVWE